MVEANYLEEVSGEVADLYVGRLRRQLDGDELYPKGTVIPASEWRDLATRHAQYRRSLVILGGAISEGELDRDHGYGSETFTHKALFFSFVEGENRAGAFLMADILKYRVKKFRVGKSGGLEVIKRAGTVARQAHFMLQEYGFKQGLLEPMSYHALDVSGVVRSVLEGRLKLRPK